MNAPYSSKIIPWCSKMCCCGKVTIIRAVLERVTQVAIEPSRSSIRCRKAIILVCRLALYASEEPSGKVFRVWVSENWIFLHMMMFRAALDCVDHLTILNDGFMHILLRWGRGNDQAFLGLSRKEFRGRLLGFCSKCSAGDSRAIVAVSERRRNIQPPCYHPSPSCS